MQYIDIRCLEFKKFYWFLFSGKFFPPIMKYQNTLATNKDKFNNRFGAQINYLHINTLKRLHTIFFLHLCWIFGFVCCSVMKRREKIKSDFIGLLICSELYFLVYLVLQKYLEGYTILYSPILLIICFQSEKWAS